MTARSKKTEEIKDGDDSVAVPAPVHPLAFDWAVYAHYLKEADLTEDQKRELIETLWTIATLFADVGFGAHPVQQAACGKQDDLAALISADVLGSKDISKDSNLSTSGEENSAAAEGSQA